MQTLNFLEKVYYEKKSLILNITLNGKEKSIQTLQIHLKTQQVSLK